MAPRGPASIVLLLLAAVGLAACTEAPPPEAPALAGRPLALSLTGCSGWQAYMGPLPPGAAAGEAPAGWEPQPGNVPVIRMAAIACERLGLGSFERPVRMVWDAHNNAAFPEGCHRSERREYASLVGTLWVSDGEVADFLAETYGLPARVADIRSTVQGNAPPQVQAWSWSDEEGASEVTVVTSPLAEDEEPSSLLLWPVGEGIGSLSLVASGRSVTPQEFPAYGQVHAPALASSMPGSRFAGRASWAEGFDVEGRFAFFRDLACEQPEAAA